MNVLKEEDNTAKFNSIHTTRFNDDGEPLIDI